jgi:putative phosphonate metabolism protein
MANFPRYAIYYAAAQDSALDRFGAEHLGYDAWTGEDIAFPDGTVEAFPDWHDLTSDARKYGFHATLKAPFGLADGYNENDLRAACAAFAAVPRAIPIINPVVDSISGFIAVVPRDTPSELRDLAADCTSIFEPFRRPTTPEDRARRRPDRLTPRQVEYLDRWGYPYVMDEFRFHMTLTCRLDAEPRQSVFAMLRQRFATTGLETLAIDRIALFRQPDPAARFRIIESWPLTRSLAAPS